MFKRVLIIAMLVMIATGLLFPVLRPSEPVQAQGSVTVVPNRDYINVRLWPAIGATVIGSLGPGDVMTATGVSVDGDWVRIDYFGDEAWIGVIVVDVVSGGLQGLPLADPRSIPYNNTPATSDSMLTIRLDDSGVRLRSGPSTAYPVIQNLPRHAEAPVTGRIASNHWLQVSWQGLVGWLAIDYITLYSANGATINDVPVVSPAPSTGARLSDASAYDRFVYVDEMRRYLDRARSTLGVVDAAWQSASAGIWPEVCSAPPLVETYFLNSSGRNDYPDLVEATLRLNQGINTVNYALQSWLDSCLNGPHTVSGELVVTAQAAIREAYVAFDDFEFRITNSKAVQVMAIHGHANFAMDQFARIEAIWLEVRMGVTGVPPCVGQPQQPADYAMSEGERASYPELVPLVDRLNEGLALIRQAIGLWKDQCDGYNSVPYYIMPLEAGIAGYNAMLEARQIMNDVFGNYIPAAYASGGIIVPAPTSTPDPTIAAILHAPYTPTFSATPTPSFGFGTSGIVVRSDLHQTCGWFGIAGQVLNPDGSPRPATLVHVYGPGLDLYVLSGSDTRYGPAGFEVEVRADAAQLNTWSARIEDGFGNPLSPEQRIVFEDGCEYNVAMVTFTAQ
jgi:hypothetical protein